MPDQTLPQTALPGQSRSAHDRTAKGLGYVSIALGIAELLAPRALCRATRLRGMEQVVRAYGAREVATGVAILTSHNPEPWIWARVAGDMADMATVATGLRRGKGHKRDNNMLTLAALTAVTAVDIACASGMNGEKASRTTAVRDYGARSGFPRGLATARGAARDFQVPDDFRAPKALRPYESGQRSATVS